MIEQKNNESTTAAILIKESIREFMGRIYNREKIEGITEIDGSKIEVYNEFSFQHELGIFLRGKFEENGLYGYKIQFERNAEKDFSIKDTVKKEIDIVVFKGEKPEEAEERYAIEIKYPDNGEYPEQMFKFVEDIMFMEQLKDTGFRDTYCLTLVDDANYHSKTTKRSKMEGIYAFFRDEEGKIKKTVNGDIYKPTGKWKGEIKYNIKGKYNVIWESCGTDKKYYLLKIQGDEANQ